MVDSLNTSLAQLSLSRLGAAAAVIGEALGLGQGIRLGQSTVFSSKVHAFNSHSPEHVKIMVNTDAGQVFYYRSDSGRIGHLDIFHECGTIDHQVAADYVCSALERYRTIAVQQPTMMSTGLLNPDLVDIQTATGGGRITGCLQGGQKPSVRRVHENHVHVALQLPTNNLVCLFYIVAAVETAIQDLGLELRCNERISYVEAADCQSDLSPYTDQTDSLLASQLLQEHNQQASCPVSDITPGSATECLPEYGYTGSRFGAGPQPAENNCRGQTFVGVEESRRGGDAMLKQRQDITVAHNFGTAFSATGLYDSFKQAVRRVQYSSYTAKCRQFAPKVQESGNKAVISGRQVGSTGLDVTATVSAAAERFYTEGISGRLRISAGDMRFTGRRQRQGSDICLLIDSSASMAGLRLLASRYLAGEISHFGCNRLSLLTFQDKQATVLRAFTNSRQAVLGAFAEIVPQGATPLALGIRYSLAYIKQQQARKPLLVLITDGIPSRRYDENIQPLTEALAAAAEIKQVKCGFLCIGLDNEDGFLQKLTTAAAGVSYSFTGFEK
ncbi:hypothetical protein SPSIL_000540 [Sporomusa silvacetica DSM 10669]|uniref:VWFA domain-containing protein n=1 Tax=Sporomusa silvacetica DSM 10669 TaxID=1123289 RepID=A0ABZ3IE61_9FIRM|nr:VWA domain-containing protein [Sporomusa silvacetica]OZC22565.1 VWA domain containing CoxE-like protein [Sporomusa silvacetica DSM 10669]